MRISDWSSDVCSSDLLAGTERHRRHAALGEREVVGAEEVAGFRAGVGGEAQVEALRGGDQFVQQVLLRAARSAEVAGRAVRVERVHVQHRHRLAQRIQRAGGVVLGAEQALLLRSDEHTSELQSLMRNSYAVL